MAKMFPDEPDTDTAPAHAEIARETAAKRMQDSVARPYGSHADDGKAPFEPPSTPNRYGGTKKVGDWGRSDE